MQKVIVHKSKELSLLKPYTQADYSSKTVLTDSCWEYVELWFKRQKEEKAKEALFYWQQAKNLYNSSDCVPKNVKPLTSYYCCLNAVKALLCINGINVKNISHGITQDKHKQSKSNSLANEEVIFLGQGVLFELSKYLGEEAGKKRYVIKDLLYNIPCVHRTFCITYSNSTELFIPINNLRYVREDTINKGWLEFKIDKRYANSSILSHLPVGYKRTHFENVDGMWVRKENKRFQWNKHSSTQERLNEISKYHGILRKDIMYIYGDTKLWYIKKNLPNNNHILNRSSLTLIFAVMHWLSELVRYNPRKFEKYMNSKQNWLLQEFMEKALHQFVDEISCEITKQEIMTTGYRK